MTSERSILFVHAHPDDEVIGTGATMARYAAAGARVTLVTCTLGEEGEIHVPALAGLAAAEADQLGGYRIGELAASCAALGVADHRFLGGAGRYRDSGMMGDPANDAPRCFWRADLDEAAGHLVAVLREVRPQVLVTYDPNGFYGHPDHIQAHRVAMRAAELAGPDAPRKIYWTAVPLSALQAGIENFRGASDNPFAGVERAEDLPFGTPDAEVHAAVAAPEHQEAKLAALRAHATQVPASSWLFSMATNFGAGFLGVEHYRLAAGTPGAGAGPHGWETDLFAGLDT
ncbi:N-acetyl-1-D-myo-inositol-2-amino-2-deoxy-alpha-D-glucopyranoside deacetylase [Pilimelia terevasa]|uniref:N-acetyl-1-D-myo-inositol-2-amino-2-deoxy-alpha- D-glucopyranoside deacetylase n=1 Tax=Pilimelia terevasa TaxID=53372 RepID=UPI001E4056FD|nr:N-acetyl-1-D-myo-inositol-2-amino-2-deoxy-alpha-D-glucopyranoside deacetylase [Pilimelia terevasa]